MTKETISVSKKWLDIAAKWVFAGMFGLFSFFAKQVYDEFKDVIKATGYNAAEIRRVEQKADLNYQASEKEIQHINERLDAKHEEFLSVNRPY